ncbi:MAG: prepilin-type N-terminal cleavage/methylation domain-containing protein [Nitrospirae bacterium]|nr:prepilin-type N-terminal cleavage/methylation domain-containing protein [Nitrospirota bacterium]
MEKRTMEIERGFTFVEILVALSILSLALLGIIGMISTGSEEMLGAEKTLTSLQTAKDRMEQLLRTGDLSSGDEDRAGGIHCTWDVAKNTPVPGLNTITVRVSWRQKVREQEMVLQRMVHS